jgi:hypothetical protein
MLVSIRNLQVRSHTRAIASVRAYGTYPAAPVMIAFLPAKRPVGKLVCSVIAYIREWLSRIWCLGLCGNYMVSQSIVACDKGNGLEPASFTLHISFDHLELL